MINVHLRKTFSVFQTSFEAYYCHRYFISFSQLFWFFFLSFISFCLLFLSFVCCFVVFFFFVFFCSNSVEYRQIWKITENFFMVSYCFRPSASDKLYYYIILCRKVCLISIISDIFQVVHIFSLNMHFHVNLDVHIREGAHIQCTIKVTILHSPSKLQAISYNSHHHHVMVSAQ